jgi:hypothetical protein
MRIRFFLFALVTVFAACQHPQKQSTSPDAGSKGQVALTYTTTYGDGRKETTSKQIAIVSAYMDDYTLALTPDSQATYGSHKICLADYSMIDVDSKFPDNKELTAVCFVLNSEEGSKGKSLITPRIYLPRSPEFDVLTPQFNCLNGIGIEVHKGKKTFHYVLDPRRIEGTVTIDSATREDLSGAIDLKDDDKSIAGSFTAHIPQFNTRQ